MEDIFNCILIYNNIKHIVGQKKDSIYILNIYVEEYI